MDMARFMAPEQTMIRRVTSYRTGSARPAKRIDSNSYASKTPARTLLPHAVLNLGVAIGGDGRAAVALSARFEMGSRPLHWRRGAKPVRSASPAAMRIVVAGLYAES